MRVGTSSVLISPPIGTPLDGFGSRHQPSLGLNDELQCKVLAIEEKSEYVVFVCCDLLSISLGQVDEIRVRITEVTPIERERVIVSATHTHSGPPVSGIFSDVSAPWFEILKDKMAEAVKNAINRMEPAAMYFGRESIELGVNRREIRDGKVVLGHNPCGPVDGDLDLIRFERLTGEPLAAMVRYTCHPVVLAGGNYRISRDYPGVLVDTVSRGLGGANVLFLQGPAGNINPPKVGGDIAEMTRVGRSLAEAALRANAKASMVVPGPIRVETRYVETDAGPMPSPEILRERKASRLAALKADPESRIGFASDCVVRFLDRAIGSWEGEQQRTLRFPVSSVRVGPLHFMTFPGELFVEYGLFFKERADTPYALPLAYSNGYVGYLPTAQAFSEGGYEVELAYELIRDYPLTPQLESDIKSIIVRLTE